MITIILRDPRLSPTGTPLPGVACHFRIMAIIISQNKSLRTY